MKTMNHMFITEGIKYFPNHNENFNYELFVYLNKNF